MRPCKGIFNCLRWDLNPQLPICLVTLLFELLGFPRWDSHPQLPCPRKLYHLSLPRHIRFSLYLFYHVGFNLSTPFLKIFGENWRGFVLVQYGRSDLYPYAFPLYPIFFFPLRSSPMRRKRSQSGLYRALVAMSRLFVYRGVRSPLFCIYYSRWSAFCQHFF